jgi:hypothetical protein
MALPLATFPGSIVRRLDFLSVALVLVLLALAAARPALGQSPEVRALPPVAVSEMGIPAQSPALAGSGPERLAVAWIVADGPNQGIHLRWRKDYLFDPPLWLPPTLVGESPRDLTLALDARGRLHAVWTALKDGRRGLFHARQDRPESPPAVIAIDAAAPGDSSAGPADFPVIAPDYTGGALIAWQSARELGYTIRVAAIDPDGQPLDFGAISSPGLSGLNPQILATDPPVVAWHAIGAIDESLRADRWSPEERRWRPAAVEDLLGPFGGKSALTLKAWGRDGLMACWPGVDAEGHSLLTIGSISRALRTVLPDSDPRLLAIDRIDRPAGEHGAPELAVDWAGQPTVAWPVFAGGRQFICVGRGLRGPEEGRRIVEVSPPSQRFAAQPRLVAIGDWSAVVWIDDARDGGSGTLWMTDIHWPLPAAR